MVRTKDSCLTKGTFVMAGGGGGGGIPKGQRGFFSYEHYSSEESSTQLWLSLSHEI